MGGRPRVNTTITGTSPRNASCARPEVSAARKRAASGSVVTASELEHGKPRLASSKVRGRCWCWWRWWRRYRWICIDFVCYSGVEAGGGVRARAWQAAAGQQHAASGSVVAASELEHSKLRLASGKVRVCGSEAEAGGGVRAADGNLPLPSRRFMTPEVGRSWRY
ncbi:hypothetical protein PR001_g26616 [Phytophthora rubi]|uniref:Uncharacterized protein n=1 Tax=Phytophthora rubi TaxID=129364 RepID=A0A6A3HVZ3_9STRA|nr:hypothetical protein PR001_g26616 [Phytophthora rubi]